MSMDENQYSQPAQPKKRIHLASVLLGLLVILLAASAVYLYVNWQNTESDLKASKAQLATKNGELETANRQLIVFRDAQRKADLNSFAETVRAYNAKTGSHLTTEGSISKNIYETQLSLSMKNAKDPKTGTTYDYVAVAAVQSPPPLKVGTIQYQWAGKCGVKTLEDTTDNSLSAVATLLEDGTMYCIQV